MSELIEDMSDLVDEFGADHTIRRPRDPASYDSQGRLHPSAISDELPVFLAAVPLTGRERLQYVGGDINREVRTLYSREALYTADEATGRQGDVLVLEEGDFEVMKSEDWGGLGAVWVSIAVKANKLPGDL